MTQKAIHMVFGSESDLEHVRKIIGELQTRGWKYTDAPSDSQKAYTIGAGSVHRDVEGTLNYVRTLAAAYMNQQQIFLTCIGLRDEASGVIASYTGKRVVACPPDAKEYGKYPGGVRVVTFSKEPEREKDIASALNWIEAEFGSPNWGFENQSMQKIHDDKRAALNKLREKVEKGEIKF